MAEPIARHDRDRFIGRHFGSHLQDAPVEIAEDALAPLLASERCQRNGSPAEE